MGHGLKTQSDGPLVFAREEGDLAGDEKPLAGDPWKILIVDDEEDVHSITRITLKDFSFEGRKIKMLSAFNRLDVEHILAREDDVAMILLDVVMEEEDTGLKLVEYIRKELKNHAVRIVLRTGQPGKAPEQTVISQYDINDYKTKPEFTAQKLFTSVTACLRAYQNLKAIERNREGLEAIINSTAIVFKHQSFYKFGHRVLEQLSSLLQLEKNPEISSAYFVGSPDQTMQIIAGTGQFDHAKGSLKELLPDNVLAAYEPLSREGGEMFLGSDYIEVYKTQEGFKSLLYITHTDKLTIEEKNLLRLYANNIAIGFDNISLSREIINTQKEVILTLGEVVETRSQETANHVTRVAEVCFLLAKEYGLDEKSAKLLRLAAPMHDVGKIGVPEAILHKPGKLTSEEFEEMKNHARIGYEILNSSNRPIMKAAAIAALQHHERWDGKGYPQGLERENIHIYGRIVAVADVFDALSHKRCYKDAWPAEKIIDLVRKSSGSHFDPALVEIFLARIDSLFEINKRFPE